MEESPELGYNYLNTAFTGTFSPLLSGATIFLNTFEDCGVARKLEGFEFK